MWYEKPNELDKSKPIFAKSLLRTYVLLRNINRVYSWVNLNTGEHLNGMNYTTVDAAVNDVGNKGFTIFNGTLTYERS